MNENKLVLENLRKKQKKLQDDLKHIEAVIQLYQAQCQEIEEAILPINSLKGLTQIEAIERIALASGGRFRIRDARSLLVKAGLINSPKGNESNIIFNAIDRSGKFKSLGHGEYELIRNKPVLLDVPKPSFG